VGLITRERLYFFTFFIAVDYVVDCNGEQGGRQYYTHCDDIIVVVVDHVVGSVTVSE